MAESWAPRAVAVRPESPFKRNSGIAVAVMVEVAMVHRRSMPISVAACSKAVARTFSNPRPGTG